MHENISWADWQILLAVLETGSYSKASKILGMTQVNVGRRIRLLEQALGLSLIITTKSRSHPTPIALMLRPTLERMSTENDEIVRVLKAADNNLAGKVTITCGGLPTHVLLPWCRQMRRLYPKLRISINATHHFLNLGSGEADIALRSQKAKEPFISESLGIATYSVCATQSYINSTNMNYTPGKREHFDWISISQNNRQLKTVKWLESHNITPRYEFSSAIHVFNACRQSLGLALLPNYLVPKSKLVDLEPCKSFHYKSWIICHKEARRIEHLAMTYESLKSYMQNLLSDCQ